MSRLTRKECHEIGKDTLARLDPEHPSIKNTVVYGPRDIQRLLMTKSKKDGSKLVARVINLGTIEAAEMAIEKGLESLALLNFASAKNPGGGFVNDQTRGQEESLCRSSGLYSCIKDRRIYQLARDNNRKCLYHDFVIISPGVPVIKNGSGELLVKPFEATFLTCPAPNGKAAMDKGVKPMEIQKTMERRIDAVLAVAARHGIKNLILGAWGTGCFGGNPEHVAKAFRWALVKFSFENVVFAITDPDKIEIFRTVFC